MRVASLFLLFAVLLVGCGATEAYEAHQRATEHEDLAAEGFREYVRSDAISLAEVEAALEELRELRREVRRMREEIDRLRRR